MAASGGEVIVGVKGKVANKIVFKKAATQIKSIRKALKKAKTFETRKTVRKIATLKEGNANEQGKVPKLERQLQALKASNLDMALEKALEAVDRLPQTLKSIKAQKMSRDAEDSEGGKGDKDTVMLTQQERDRSLPYLYSSRTNYE